ncbi:MAG: hypothetical protein CMJ94_13210 [Planctomycetes bacterium]|nr:hypothetical protein [Planctomycetota bacterium]
MSLFGRILMVILILAGAAAAQEEVQTRTTIGIEGRVYLEHEGRPLQAVEAREDALLLLRIGEVEDLGDNRQRVELLFLARRAGDFDLRDALQFGPEQPVGDALEPILVRVDSLLPEDHQGDLEAIPDLEGPGAGGFDTIFRVVLVLWLIPALAWALWKWRTRPRPEPVVVEHVPTLAERLQPLIDAARQGELDLAGQAQLERLLLSYWRERLGLEGQPQAAAVRTMRAHEEAGELLRTVEAWLHRPDSERASPEEVDALLKRYRSVAAPPTEDRGP